MNNVDKQWTQSDIGIQVRFQKLLFPEGLTYVIQTHRFETTKISPLYRYVRK
jgi:hypothetical protein